MAVFALEARMAVKEMQLDSRGTVTIEAASWAIL
jgi:hypothetical protein